MPVATRSQSTPIVSSPQRDKYKLSMDTSNGGNGKKVGYAGNCSNGRNGGNGDNGGNGLAHYENLRAMSRGKLKPLPERNPDDNNHANNSNNGKAGGGGVKELLPRVGKYSHPSVDLMMTPRILEISSHRVGCSSEPLEACKEAATVAPLGERFDGFTNSWNSTPANTLREEKPIIPTMGGCEEKAETFRFDSFRNTQVTEATLQGRSFGGDIFTCPRPSAVDRHGETSILTGFASGMETDVGVKARKRRFTEELESAKEEEDHTTLLGHQGTRIMVHVRLRPLSKKEKEGGARSCVRVVNKRDVYLTEFTLETDYLRLKRLKGRHFTFDTAFPESTGQQEVYNVSTSELVEAVVQGRNGSVFCYGATGAGKTHTMLGTVHCPGVMVLALKDLFSKLRQRSIEGQYVVRLSYLEVYNETVRDLLSPGRPLVLREDSKQGIVAAGLTQYQAFSAEEVMALLQQGNQNRTTEPTRANETSSRSHAILQVVAEYKMQQESGYISRVGKLSLIDLAGSERASATDHRTLRSLEGANINRSLLALSSCINALVEGKKHIPYRNSKLTQLLKDSLGGACQTSMIANISPSNLSFGETQNTLHWADRAKEIRTKACIVNEELQIPESAGEQAKLLLEMQKENQHLRMQMARLQQKLILVQSNALQASVGDPPSPSSSVPVILPPSCSPRGLKKGAVVSTATTPAHCCPPECRKDDRTLIEELQRTVRALEKENMKLRCGNADRVEKPKKATMMNVESPPSLHNSPIKSPSRKDGFDLKAIRTTTASARSISSTTATKLMSDKSKRLATTTKAPMKTSSVAGPIGDRHRSRIGGSRTPDASPPRTPVSRFCSPSKDIATSIASQIRKRTFWDITNSNSPSATVGRCTRSNVAAGPSLLLQPGFLRNRPLN